MRIAVTGSSGLIGVALARSLEADGHEVVRVVRSREGGPGSVRWDPDAGDIDAAGLEGLDGVVHLAGEPVAARRWTEEHKRRILESRTRGTSLIARTLAERERRPPVLISASAMDAYADLGDAVVTEQSPLGDDFLARVVREWEAATQPAAEAGIRVVCIRTGIVLSPEGGALARMLPLFKLGLGGRLGSGRQWWSWISIDDEVRAIRFLLEHDVSGPVNLASPNPVTNAELTRALGRVLRRPTVLPVPAFGPRLLLGRELADKLVFGNRRLRPAVLEAAGFEFSHPDIDTALRAVLGR